MAKAKAKAPDDLDRILRLAWEQALRGKGLDRHGGPLPWRDQPIIVMARLQGSNHGPLYQATKKLTESLRLVATDRHDQAKAELLGAIVYTAAAYLLLEEPNA
jgi:hypothetical protein